MVYVSKSSFTNLRKFRVFVTLKSYSEDNDSFNFSKVCIFSVANLLLSGKLLDNYDIIRLIGSDT